ncbi:hypothetical protein ADK86_15215 [Streptomyces sp. NRRL F-5755]|nr:hypothetical protein ADK86_15215 [Streptomyces sp. NRRL F-5755]
MYGGGAGRAGQYLTDDAGGETGGEERADALYDGDVGLGVVPVAIGQALGVQQTRPLVVAQQPLAGPGPLGQLPDPHGPVPLA